MIGRSGQAAAVSGPFCHGSREGHGKAASRMGDETAFRLCIERRYGGVGVASGGKGVLEIITVTHAG